MEHRGHREHHKERPPAETAYAGNEEQDRREGFNAAERPGSPGRQARALKRVRRSG